MTPPETVWIVVPAYNEAKSIGTVVAGLRHAGYGNVCVVNDGSADQTATLALRAGAHVVEHITNLGQGAALQTGIDYALGHGAEIIVCTFDADGQHVAASFADLLELAQRSNADVALGSRFLRESNRACRHCVGCCLSALLFTRMHARLKVSDTHNGCGPLPVGRRKRSHRTTAAWRMHRRFYRKSGTRAGVRRGSSATSIIPSTRGRRVNRASTQ